MSSGASYDLVCRSGSVESTYGRADWSFTATAGAPPVVRVSNADRTLVAATITRLYDADEGAGRTVQAGQRFRVVGAPGTWPVPSGSETGGSFVSLTSSDLRADSALLGAATVSANGASLSFVIPTDLGYQFYDGEDVLVRVSADRTSPGSATTPQRTMASEWRTPVKITSTGVTTTTRVNLSSSVALSTQQVRATATVVTTVPIPPESPFTEVTFKVDGRAVGTVEFFVIGGPKPSILLPRLAPGRYQITAEYAGGFNSKPSTSPAVTLLIVN